MYDGELGIVFFRVFEYETSCCEEEVKTDEIVMASPKDRDGNDLTCDRSADWYLRIRRSG
jgi:hypothetical protein